MSQKRLHKTLNPATVEVAGEAPAMPNLFDNMLFNGKPLEDLTTAARRVNPSWPAYEKDICIETYALDYNVGSQYEVPQMMVLRANMSCCCDQYCNHPGHSYAGGGAFRTAASAPFSPMIAKPAVAHPPAHDYVEATIDLNTLTPLMLEAKARVPVPEQRSALAAEIKAEADGLTLTAEEIETQLGIVGQDEHGLLMGAGSAANVLAGEDADPTDYFWVAAFVILFQRLIASVHTKLTKDWPQRGQFKNSMFASTAR
jgi:hypothetical protein